MGYFKGLLHITQLVILFMLLEDRDGNWNAYFIESLLKWDIYSYS